MTTASRFALAFAALSLASLQGCPPPASQPDASADAATLDQSSPDAMSTPDAMSAPDAASTADSASQPDAAAGERSATIGTGVCFSFASGTGNSDNPCGNELYTLAGLNVDLGAGRGETLCLLPGTFANLAAVPTDYASCMWTGYIEGAEGLANRGLIVRSVDGTHHYRVWIQSNTQPSLIFRWAPID